jgi:hypothetical protein
MIVNSDAHEPSDLLRPDFQRAVALGAGIPAAMLEDVIISNPAALRERVLSRRT